jgi:hydrogenase/urease accessory protein HupE
MSALAQVSRVLEWRFLLAVAISILALTSVATAHEVRPAYLQIDQIGVDRFNVLWRTPLLSGARLPVVLQFSDRVRQVTKPSERQLSDSVVERSLVESTGGLPGQRITFIGLQATITDVLVRVRLADGTVSTTLVRPSRPWIEVQAREGAFQVARVFVFSGVEHILFGFDHLLFVAALMLIVRDWRALVKAITAFTVAHSITLTCATLGWVALPPAPIEVMIAVSIVFVGAEIVRMERGGASLTIAWPWVVAFVFGLLHGFGFAGALVDVGLPQGDIPLALFSFNVGVELGQLMFIAAILLAVQLIQRIVVVPRQAITASAYVIGTVAAFWSIDRLQSTFA